MAITLTVDQAVTNGKRVVLEKRRMLLDQKIFSCVVVLKTAVNGSPPDAEISARVLQITGPQGGLPGSGTVVGKNTTITAGDRFSNLLRDYPPIEVTDAQWSALVTAHNASVGSLETHLLSAGYLHSTLAGT